LPWNFLSSIALPVFLLHSCQSYALKKFLEQNTLVGKLRTQDPWKRATDKGLGMPVGCGDVSGVSVGFKLLARKSMIFWSRLGRNVPCGHS